MIFFITALFTFILVLIWYNTRTREQYIANDMQDYNGKDEEEQIVTIEKRDELNKHCQDVVAQIQTKYQPEKHKHVLDFSMYSGPLGIAYMYLKLYLADDNQDQLLLDKALAHVHMAEARLDKYKLQFCSFLCGAPGIYALAAVLYNLKFVHQDKIDDHNKSEEYLKKFVDFHAQVMATSSSSVMFGKAGYLMGCHFLNKYLRYEAISTELITSVFEAIIEHGKRDAKKMHLDEKTPLFWDAYNQEALGNLLGLFMYNYTGMHFLGSVFAKAITSITDFRLLGMTQGVSGILFVLLCFEDILFAHPEWEVLVKASIEFVLNTRQMDGHYKTMASNNESDCAEFAQGTTAALVLFLKSYKHFREYRYLRAAQDASDVIWGEGLLRKGNGLAHGIAGNAYAFLLLYKVTTEPKYLHRALKFVEFMTSERAKQSNTSVDYSLLDGLAGTAILYKQMQEPIDANMPLFEL